MKHTSIAYGLAMTFVLTGCAGLAAHHKKVDNARNACYKQDSQTVYRETYAVLAAEHKITRESERRGFIETDWAEKNGAFGNRWQQKVSAEIMEGGCNRVVLRVKANTWDVNNNQWVESTDVRGVEDGLYLKINRRITQHRAKPTATATTKNTPPPPPTHTTTTTPPPTKPQIANGMEGGKCYPNGTCNGGLTCASNLCVNLKKN